MRRPHSVLSVVAAGVTAALVLAVPACGDDDSTQPTPTATATTSAMATATVAVPTPTGSDPTATGTEGAPTATPDAAVIEAPTATPAGDQAVVIDVSYVGGAVTVDDDRVSVSVGDTVEIQVVSDVAEELHIHTYDLSADLDPGERASIRFEADIPGISEVEFERSGAFVLELEVR